MADNCKIDKKVAVLGPRGTFSHSAALKFFSSENLLMKSSITEIFRSIDSKEINLGIVPAENSIKGPVFETVDNLLKFSLKVRGSFKIDINHCLLGRVSDLSKISIIKSHPQALGQCNDWINKNFPDVKLSSQPSTVSAISEDKDQSVAFIASETAAKEYGLTILSKNIQDKPGNKTEFYFISGQEDPELKKILNPKKTLIAAAAYDRPGILYDILGYFAKRGLNLSKLHSRPSGIKGADYYFLIEVEASLENKLNKEALQKVEKLCSVFKILGET